MFRVKIGLFFLLFSLLCRGQINDKIVVGAEQPEVYLSMLKDKNVGLVVNHTSMVDSFHLVDFLLQNNVKVKIIFAPEHGFRGDVSAGGAVNDEVDVKTGITVLSLYGKTKKPTSEQLAGVDVLIFDIQDVGCRFYTYISTLHLVMEACAENLIPLIVLDRPNPNGDYIAGPVRKKGFESFVSMDPIPLVHGCTVGELARLINGESWLKDSVRCDLTVIPVLNYDHHTRYSLPVRPSPNLPNDLAVRLYPSLCFFEATSVSIGRGTEFPFQVIGGLKQELGDFEFTPKSIPGVADHPLNQDKQCYGIDLRGLEEVPQFTLKFFLDFYNKYKVESEFLTNERWLNLLAGTDDLIRQVRNGNSEEQISKSWQPELEAFRLLREKYLLYPDF
jgi:uncharacterized protein YbbC (DUF1343 family)